MENDITKKEIIEFVMNFDKVTAVKMPPQKQVKFIVEHLETFKRDILSERQIHSTFGDMLTTLFRTSYRIWNLYRPGFLATIQYGHQALLAEIGHATNILIANISSLKRYLTLDSLVLYCVSSIDVPTAIPLMTAIEEKEPGTIKNAKDIFGNNALWYTFYRTTNLNFYQSTSANEYFEALSRFLLDNGVSPDAANCLDLTYSSMRKAQIVLSKIAD